MGSLTALAQNVLAPAPFLPPPRKSLYQRISEFKLSQSQLHLLQIIGQIAVQIFFALSAILMAAVVFPLSVQVVVVPLIAVSTVFLTAFFFPTQVRIPKQELNLPPLLVPQDEPRIQLAPPPALVIPPNAPRGIFREGMNCSINSALQVVDGVPALARWFRLPVPLDLDGFINFLGPYHPPDPLVRDFRLFFGAQNPPMEAPVAFFHFLGAQPRSAQIFQFQDLSLNLLLTHPTLRSFFSGNDAASQGNRPTNPYNSQMVRLAISQVAPRIDRSSERQEDAAEVMHSILAPLPSPFKMKYEEVLVLGKEGLPPLAEEVLPKEEESGVFTLEIEGQPDLEKMFQNYCDYAPGNSILRMGTDGRRHQYPVIRKQLRLKTFPEVLQFQVKRFQNVPPPASWLARFLPNWFPGVQWRSEKIGTPIRVPREFTIRLDNGNQRRFRLSGCINHHGNSPDSGHYTAARIVGETHYLIDDAVVTQVDGAAFDRVASTSYLQVYVPVGD